MNWMSHSLAWMACCASVIACSERALDFVDEVEPVPVEDALVTESCLPTLDPSGVHEGVDCPAFSLIDPGALPPGVCAGCFCAQPCETAADCSEGVDAGVPIQCDPRGWCVLDCDEAPCPDKMRCIPDTSWGRSVCHWVVADDDEGVCQLVGG